MNAAEEPTSTETVLEPLGVHRTPLSVARTEPTSAAERNKKREQNNPLYVAAREAYHNSPDALFNDSDPFHVVVHEQPYHRIMVILKAEGKSNREVAALTGYTESTVCTAGKQPWFRLRLIQYLNEAGKDQIAALLKGAATDSVYTLIELRDSQTASPAVRKSAADSLLDRWIGKPVQKVELENTKLPSTEEIRSLDAQIAECDRQLETPQPQNEPQK